ncbi:uncharacterized protein BJX67DRAFT_221674 [Aspergillus lucknowensis]|uniref:Fungal N-terminal domain-containing protein n=1 Tax=Aspergillus lucknowensis TaxID=176173 RepID=A0ABR4LIZ4_9EURO
MDPLSIAATSAALRVSCLELYTFTESIIRDKVPDSDLAIATLGSVVRTVAPLLEEISNTWRSHSPSMMIHPTASFGMWLCVQSTLERTETILRQLKKKVEPIVESGRKRTFTKMYAKAWKLGLNVRAISTYRGCLDANHTALKVGVNMMRMCVRLHSGTPLQDKHSFLAVLDVEISNLEAGIHTARKLPFVDMQEDSERQELLVSMEGVVKSARAFHSFMATAPLHQPGAHEQDGHGSAPPPPYAQTLQAEASGGDGPQHT